MDGVTECGVGPCDTAGGGGYPPGYSGYFTADDGVGSTVQVASEWMQRLNLKHDGPLSNVGFKRWCQWVEPGVCPYSGVEYDAVQQHAIAREAGPDNSTPFSSSSALLVR